MPTQEVNSWTGLASFLSGRYHQLKPALFLTLGFGIQTESGLRLDLGWPHTVTRSTGDLEGPKLQEVTKTYHEVCANRMQLKTLRSILHPIAFFTREPPSGSLRNHPKSSCHCTESKVLCPLMQDTLVDAETQW